MGVQMKVVAAYVVFTFKEVLVPQQEYLTWSQENSGLQIGVLPCVSHLFTHLSNRNDHTRQGILIK